MIPMMALMMKMLDVVIVEPDPDFTFTLKAETLPIEELQVFIDGTQISQGDTYTVQGSEYKNIQLKAKYEGSNEYEELYVAGYSISSNNKDLETDMISGAGMRFHRPGKGEVTITYGENKTFTFSAESVFVPIESVSLQLPEVVGIHQFIYSMGAADNYVGILETTLRESYEVLPANASFKRNVTWTGNNDAVSTYMATHTNGFIGHSAGDIDITLTVSQEGYAEDFSKTQKVTFTYKQPIEALDTETKTITVKKGERVVLPIIYTPTQPSQALMEWTMSGKGQVEVTRAQNGEYDRYSNTTYRVKGIQEGTVTITGTPVAVKEGTSPSITFEIKVVGEDGTVGDEGTQETPDTSKLVTEQKESILNFYTNKASSTWEFGREWDIIALKRSGIGFDFHTKSTSPLEEYKASVLEELQNPDGKLTSDGKPIDLARVALALYTIGEDQKHLVA